MLCLVSWRERVRYLPSSDQLSIYPPKWIGCDAGFASSVRCGGNGFVWSFDDERMTALPAFGLPYVEDGKSSIAACMGSLSDAVVSLAVDYECIERFWLTFWHGAIRLHPVPKASAIQTIQISG